MFMLNFNLELEANDLIHNSTEANTILSNIFATIFDPCKYDKLDKKVANWFNNYADAFFKEANLPPYFNLYVKKTTESIEDLNQYINLLPLELNHTFLGKVYGVSIVDDKNKTTLGTMFMFGIAKYDENNDLTECIIYVLVHEA